MCVVVNVCFLCILLSIRLFFLHQQVKIKFQHNDKNYIDGEKKGIQN